MLNFSSNRERRLWIWAFTVVAVIYATLGLARTLAGILRDEGLIEGGFWLGLFLIGAAVLAQGVKAKPGGAEIGIALGIAGAYLIAFLRLSIPEERSHLIEYSIVALFIYEALKERARNGRHVPVPALLAIVITTVLGIIDEGIQLLLPQRVFDLVDIGFNALAAVMAVTGNAALSWARGLRRKHPDT